MRPETPVARISRSNPAAGGPWFQLLCAASLLLAMPGALAQDTSEARLERLRTQIGELRASLERDAEQLTAAREQAFELERTVADATDKQAALEARIRQKRERIEALKATRDETAQYLEHARNGMLDNAAARYVLSFQPKLKVLLHQDDARKLSRNLAYYDYVIDGYREQAVRMAERVRQLDETEAALKLETDKLRRLRYETKRHLEFLLSVRSERAALVAATRRRMNDGNARIEQLEQDESHLMELLEQLVAAPTRGAPGVPFAELRGKLDWPTTGHVAKAPGMALRDGGARWAGVLIKTAGGNDVRSVAHGRIVFADFFRNLGQLVIIDHGDGYMTLYGNNAALHGEAGDEVEAGDVIATVGAGEGELPQGLYFELRAAGEPLDPRNWCVSRQGASE